MKRRSILLCEGETDQVLLSYYFKQKSGYEYIKKCENLLCRKSQEESVCLYRQKQKENGEELIIWAVGSQSLIPEALSEILGMNQSNTENVYSRIAILTDRDSDEENANFWESINHTIISFGIDVVLEEQKWIKLHQSVEFDEEVEIEILGLSIPLDKDGALETFLLSALEEQDQNRYLAQQSEIFVRGLIENREYLCSYLTNRRLCVKAPLAVFFAIANPERTFHSFDNILKSVSWEKYTTIRNAFHLLDEFDVSI